MTQPGRLVVPCKTRTPRTEIPVEAPAVRDASLDEFPDTPAMGRVDLRPLKQRVASLFPPGHAYREAILQEPDWLDAVEWRLKSMAYVNLAWSMRNQRQP